MSGTNSIRVRAFGVSLITAVFCMLPIVSPDLSKAVTGYSASLNGLANTMREALAGDMVRSSPFDSRYYAGGVWHANDGPPCWYCYDGAAVGAATLSQQGGGRSLARVALATFNEAISRHQLSSGAFADPNGQAQADSVGTGFFTVELGISFLELRTTLDPTTRARWNAAVRKAAAYLISSGDTTWYINGNVNLRQTEVMWLAWTITHQRRFLNAYNSEWAFTIAPSQQRWPGFGLHITKRAARPDGYGGEAYLAESDGGAPGFDPSYTDAQLDTATDLYVLTRDPRYLRLMNLLFDKLRPRINANWILNAERGSRKSYMMPFMDPAVSVLAASGSRPDLVPDVSAQLDLVASEYRAEATFTNVNFYKGFESWLSMPLLNREWPQGMAPSGTTRRAARPSVLGTLTNRRQKGASRPG